MKLSTIMPWSDGYTDEVLTNALALGFANKMIAEINTKFRTKLPFITNVDTDYTQLDSNWFLIFMLGALNYGIKLNDGSLSEAQTYKNDIAKAMYDFEGIDMETAIADPLLRPAQGSSIYIMDTSNAIDVGWWGISDEWVGW